MPVKKSRRQSQKKNTSVTKKATAKSSSSPKKPPTVSKKKNPATKKATPTYIDREQYVEWEQNVIAKLGSSKALKSASAVYLLQRLFVVLDGDVTQWTTVEEKQNGRILEMCDVNTGETRTFLHRTPFRRRSTQLTQYVASDLRGITYYTAVNNDAKWIAGLPSYTFNQKQFHVDGKEVKVDAFVTRVLTSFFATQKSNAKSLKPANDPSKDKAIVRGLAQWLTSVQSIINADTVTVKLAYAHFNPDRTPNRTDPLRLFVPASKVRAEMGSYYVRERDSDTKRVQYRSCVGTECDKKFLAVDVDDSKAIVENVHLSINEPEAMVKYQAVKQ